MIKAVVFDMDGTLFDTERLAIAGWEHVGRVTGYPIHADLVMKLLGRNIKNCHLVFQEALGADFDFYRYRKLKTAYIEDYIATHGMPVLKGARELLAYLKERGYPLALATSTDRATTLYNLKNAGFTDYFSGIVCGDMVENSKPAPDIYLAACASIQMNPGDCIALEESPAGVTSAYRAGLHPVMIPDLQQPDETIQSMLYARLDSLDQAIALLEKDRAAGK